MEQILTTLVAGIHVLAWSVYVGGAIVMEFVLRHAQNTMQPSQVAVVCQNSGKRYRWWSALCLAALLVTGLLLARSVEPGTTAWSLLLALGLLWFVLACILALLSFYIHPEMHIRVSPSMTKEEVTVERQRVKRAIHRMDMTVRIELALALLAMALGAALHL